MGVLDKEMPRKRPQLSRQSATAKRLRLMRSKKTEDEQRQSAQTRRSESTCPPLLGQDPTRRMEPARTEGDAGKTEPFEAVFVTVKTELPDEDDAGTWVACSAANAAVKEEQATHAGVWQLRAALVCPVPRLVLPSGMSTVTETAVHIGTWRRMRHSMPRPLGWIAS
ncbi:uncharacterized protein LOC134528463 isoform X5 [Bacillus rossius redtenbacheri]|uniref:uncharacterized protein LOC134528463 isoform X5 n=1 Tax=Bacillus rossius redtenbacheri TaxID=93214 RepID=UPI002FDDCD14